MARKARVYHQKYTTYGALHGEAVPHGSYIGLGQRCGKAKTDLRHAGPKGMGKRGACKDKWYHYNTAKKRYVCHKYKSGNGPQVKKPTLVHNG